MWRMLYLQFHLLYGNKEMTIEQYDEKKTDGLTELHTEYEGEQKKERKKKQ